MPTLFAFLTYLIACMALSALITPNIQPWLEGILGLTPDRSLYRFAMLLSLLGMPLLLSYLKLGTRHAMGFASLAPNWSGIGRGFLYGSLILGLLASMLLWLDARNLHSSQDIGLVFRTLISGALSGLLVGLIEEFFFRGPLQTGARRRLSFWPTAILIGLFYASVHFIRPLASGEAEYTISQAFSMLLGGYANLANIADYWDSFTTLWIAGIFLSMVRERTGSIFWAIGIHAGWVTAIKLTKHTTEANHGSDAMFWIGNYDHITGIMASIWLASIASIYWWWSNPQRNWITHR